MLSVFQRMLILFAMMALGYIAGKAKVMTLQGNKALSMLVNCITNPCAVLYSALCGEHVLSNLDILKLIGIAVLMFTFLILTAQLVPKLLRVEKAQAGKYKFMMIFSNIGYMGIPVITAVFGASATICVTIFIMVFYFFIYTYGIFLIHGDKQKGFQWKSLLTPMLICSVLGIVCYLLHIQLTGAAAEFLNTVRGVTTPCAMMIIGCALSALPVKALFTNWRLYIISLLKLLLIPAAVYLCLRNIMADKFLPSVLVVIMAMPVASNFTMLCAQYDQDQFLPATSVFVTTLLSVVTIPLLCGFVAYF